MTPELHRPVAVDRIGLRGMNVVVQATPAECMALAGRMGIPAVRSLTCRFRVVRDAAGRFVAQGHLTACVVQTCVVSLDDFSAELQERFRIRFVPDGEETDALDPADPVDELGYQGGVLDLGEAAAQQLGLALDPYPRRPGAELPGSEVEAAPNPFDVLRRH